METINFLVPIRLGPERNSVFTESCFSVHSLKLYVPKPELPELHFAASCVENGGRAALLLRRNGPTNLRVGVDLTYAGSV